MQDQSIFNSYKPLRNAIRKLCLNDSLSVIRAYMQNLQFDTPIPADCEVLPEYASANSKIDKVRWISEFQLETLCREIIIHASEEGPCPETLRKWITLARTLNKLKDLENIIGERIHTADGVMQELHRVAHRQFPWQASRPTASNIIRYFLVYKHSSLEAIIQRTIGLNVEELFLVGMACLGTFATNIALFYPPNIEIPSLSIDSMDRFLRHFALDLRALKQSLQTEVEMNDKFAYAYSSLRAYPIMRMSYQRKDSLVCPLPTLLFWRFTSGVYYEICGQDDFANAFGEAFQSYVGQVLKRANRSQTTQVYPEEPFKVGRDLKRTVDWIIDQQNAAVFIEAKTKRLTVEARVEGISGEPLSAELDKMATMIVQVYKSIRDYRDGHYPNFGFFEARQIYPMVVTLEDWFLIGPRIKDELSSKVSEGIKAEQLPLIWLKEMPYTVCSIQDLERAAQVMNQIGIDRAMRGKAFDPVKQEWTLGAYLKDSFNEEFLSTQFLFKDEFDQLHLNALSEQT